MQFLDLVPAGWLRDYLLAMHDTQNEMPLPFHFLSGCVAIGNIIGLRAWATLGKGVRVYPNVNVMLLSPAGKCRRGEGTKIAMKIAARAGVSVLAGKTTPEALLDELMETGDTLLYVEELSMLLTKQDFQRPMIPVLTKLLLHGDGGVTLRTRGMGRKELPFVNLSALFTTAPDWFMTTIPEEAFGGGLMSRFVVCCLDEREVMNIDIMADDVASVELIAKLAEGLAGVRGVLDGHVKGDAEAQAWIAEWYIRNETELVEDSRLLPHRNRKPANLLRMAMILAAATNEDTLTKTRLEQALAILDYMEPTLIKLYGLQDEVVDRLHTGERRIINKLARVQDNELLHAELARSCSVYFPGGMRDMRLCLEGMVEKGLLEAKYKNGVMTWPPKSWHLRGLGGREEADV